MLNQRRLGKRERVVRGEQPEPGAVVVRATRLSGERLAFTVRHALPQEARALVLHRLNLCCGVRLRGELELLPCT
jgi:hypothetical protein